MQSYAAAALVIGYAVFGTRPIELANQPETAVARQGGWLRTLKRTYQEISADRVPAVAAGVTYYGLLSIFPALTALVSIYGLFADPQTAVSHIGALASVLPQEAIDLISTQMKRIAAGPSLGLGFAALLALGLALWSANAGTKAVIDSLNVAYDVPEGRSFIRLNGHSLAFTVGALVMMIVLIGAVAVVPVVLKFVFVSAVAEWLLWAGRWPLVLAVLMLGLGILYRFGPDRPKPHWRWLVPGSALASAGLLVLSMLFSWYAANLGHFNETYGSLGAVIAFMTWLWLSTLIVIVGAEFNAEIERNQN